MTAKIIIKIATENSVDVEVLEIILELPDGITRAEAAKKIKHAMEQCGEVVSYETSA